MFRNLHKNVIHVASQSVEHADQQVVVVVVVVIPLNQLKKSTILYT